MCVLVPGILSRPNEHKLDCNLPTSVDVCVKSPVREPFPLEVVVSEHIFSNFSHFFAACPIFPSAVFCQPPVAPANGSFKLLNDSYSFSSLVEFSCSDGYHLVGNRIQRCNMWEWSGPPVRCDKNKGTSLLHIAHHVFIAFLRRKSSLSVDPVTELHLQRLSLRAACAHMWRSIS